MTSRELQYKYLIRQFDQNRTRKEQEQKLRELEVYRQIPAIAAIDKKLNQTGIKLIRSMLSTKDTVQIDAFKESSKELLTTKKMLLVEGGFSEDYLEVHYDCKLCKDTGFIEANPCKCFKQAQINLAYEQSNLKHLLKFENFDTFKLDYYSNEIDPDQHLSPLENMKRIYHICLGFVEKFEYEKGNLLFHGPTGLGKTFLCNCIAKWLLDSGYTVLYLTSPQLFRLFEESRFHREDMEDEAKDILSTLLTVDLLIIDDLGTETSNSFTGPDLFHVLNTRHLNQNATIISTNLNPNEWKTYYSERILSRIFGNYTNLRLFGTDIRVMKKYLKK